MTINVLFSSCQHVIERALMHHVHNHAVASKPSKPSSLFTLCIHCLNYVKPHIQSSIKSRKKTKQFIIVKSDSVATVSTSLSSLSSHFSRISCVTRCNLQITNTYRTTLHNKAKRDRVNNSSCRRIYPHPSQHKLTAKATNYGTWRIHIGEMCVCSRCLFEFDYWACGRTCFNIIISSSRTWPCKFLSSCFEARQSLSFRKHAQIFHFHATGGRIQSTRRQSKASIL